jgi:subtilisin family serine protease
VGYPFDAKWFGCGQSPLCVEVDRLVRSGVVVVSAAGNSGYGTISTAYTKGWASTLPQTINDPGNADLAITVGSTHREEPHLYGVSYFSSKGPTGDGRLKPDLVAPGERIVSCASAQSRLPATVSNEDGTTKTIAADGYTYREDSGTSMAAPHVSGVIAAFLSIRKEYIGQPETVKALFVDNATDLKRDRTFQGGGLVDIMRAIQAV